MARLNLDPVDFFKKNMCDINGGYYWVEGQWWENHFLSYNDVMDHAAEHFGWKEKFPGWLKPYKVVGSKPVSYTHLDVYKRQSGWRPTRKVRS